MYMGKMILRKLNPYLYLFHFQPFIKVVFIFICCLTSWVEVRGDDWPMWRYDAGRTASTSQGLAKELHLQWVRHLPPPRPAWSKVQFKLQFDGSYEPIAKGHTLFVPSMVSDRVTAYDTRTGEEKWRFYTEGPVRFAPVTYQDKVFFICDDGFLYCLQSETGTLIRKFRGGPEDRLVLGNDRLINMWPARGGPVLYDGKIYFAASIWPFMGIFLYAIDADTGEVVWENSGTGSLYITQQHNSPAFAGVAPQGYFAATENRLLVAGGRTVPCVYDRKNGKFNYYQLSSRHFHKSSGGYNVSVAGKYFFNRDEIFKLADGKGVAAEPADVMRNDEIIGVDKTGVIRAYKLTPKPKGLWKTPPQSTVRTIHLRAGNRIYGSGPQGHIAALDLPNKSQSFKQTWRYQIKGEVWNMIAADERLFVVTMTGAIYCFGPENMNQPKEYSLQSESLPGVDPERQKLLRQILEDSTIRDGYCLLLGLGDGHLLYELIRQTNFQIIALDSDITKVETFRRRLDNAGLYGRRVTVLHGDVTTRNLPPYFAKLILTEDAQAAGFTENNHFAQKVFSRLRPYGGAAYFCAQPKNQLPLFKQVIHARLENVDLKVTADYLRLVRRGALPGSADWTHQYGDIANTVCSKDQRVKAPLGILWFGDRLDFTDVLPRHGHGPPEQVVAGRLFMEGIDSLCVRDVYTGRVLWKKTLPKFNQPGIYYDKSYIPDPFTRSYNQVHIPGANVRGTNYVATENQVYVIQNDVCLVLDAATGKELKTISLLPLDKANSLHWGYIGVYKEYLIATAGFATFADTLQKEMNVLKKKSKEQKKKWEKLEPWLHYYDKSAGQYLVVMNRQTGKILWHRKAQHGWLHNAIIVGKDRLFCLDAPPPLVRQILSAQALEMKTNSRLLSLAVSSGDIVWETDRNVFGSWLSYSDLYDVLIQATRPSKDMLPEPSGRMIAYRGVDGKVIWDKPHLYTGPCMLHHNTIITQEKAFDLLTGEPKMRKHPLTGEPAPWEYARNYGCNTAIACENLLTFRSAAAGYFDLANDGGTGNFGGFRSGCTSNLVAADGVLNAPDYTYTCTCSYQNQTSLALFYMPEVETWTFSKIDSSKEPIRRVGVNLGAPGDRKAANGTLWLDYPSVGGKSPDIVIKTIPEKPEYFRRHSSLVQANSLPWVVASGATGIKQIKINLSGKRKVDGAGQEESRKYRIRLYFLEPDRKRKPGERIFNVALQGKTVLKNFDILAAAGKANVGMVKEFNNIGVNDDLVISLQPASDCPIPLPILCGIEILLEDRQ